MKTFLKIADLNNIERFSWIECVLAEAKKNKNISKIINLFKNDTENELWDNKKELNDFLSKKDTIEKFLSGAYGANILVKYRIMAISRYMKDICLVAKKATLSCLKNKKNIFPNINIEKFINEVEQFEYLKKKSFLILTYQMKAIILNSI